MVLSLILWMNLELMLYSKMLEMAERNPIKYLAGFEVSTTRSIEYIKMCEYA